MTQGITVMSSANDQPIAILFICLSWEEEGQATGIINSLSIPFEKGKYKKGWNTVWEKKSTAPVNMRQRFKKNKC